VKEFEEFSSTMGRFAYAALDLARTSIVGSGVRDQIGSGDVKKNTGKGSEYVVDRSAAGGMVGAVYRENDSISVDGRTQRPGTVAIRRWPTADEFRGHQQLVISGVIIRI
jgi:hypothetical protein